MLTLCCQLSTQATVTGTLEFLEKMVQLEHLDPQVLGDHQEITDSQDQRDVVETRDSPGDRDVMELLAQRDLRDRQERTERGESQEHPEHRGEMVSVDYRESLECLECTDHRGRPESLGLMGDLDLQG